MLRKAALLAGTLLSLLGPMGCIGGSGAPKAIPPSSVLTVNSTSPASGVVIAVTPADNNAAGGGSTSFTRTYTTGTSVTLTAPATSGAYAFQSWTGCTQASSFTCAVTMSADTTVTANYAAASKLTPTVTVTPSPATLSILESLAVTVSVTGASGNPLPTGSVVLTSGSYASTAATLVNGSATITLPAGGLPQGSDTLTVAYTPDAASTSIYNGNTGTAWVTVTAPVYTLTIGSAPPSSGVPIAVAPADNNAATGGTTSFARLYYAGASVTVTAPATYGGRPFVSWSGCTSASTIFCTVTMNANAAVIANYVPNIYTLTVNSTDPASGVAIGVSPADNNNATTGTTSFTRAYNEGTSVTLTAPATSGNYSFVSWSGCASASTLACTVAMNGNTAVTANYAPTPYTLTVNSTDPANGVAIGVTPADNNTEAGGTTRFTRTYNVGTSVTLTAPATSGSYTFVSWSGCASASILACTVAMNGNTAVTANYAPTPYTLTVNSTDPASGVAIGVTPADNNNAGGGSTSFTRTYNAGTSVTLTAPATADATPFLSWTGCTTATSVACTVAIGENTTVTANYGKITPTMTVTPSPAAIVTWQDLTVTVALSAGSGLAAPTGTVVLTSGSYTSAATTLTNGSAAIDVPAGSLGIGSDILTATYTPDAASSATFNSVTGTSSAVAVVTGSTVSVDQSTLGPAVSSQLMGMNMAAWFDPSTAAILPAFQSAGIQAIRWPGGSWSDDYHWATNTLCNGSPNANATFSNFIDALVTPGNLDVAITANYGTNAACDGPGDSSEAASWAAYAVAHSANVSHITVGNEEYGSWETDLHSLPHDAATYATATATDYYPQIKAADASVLVGVDVNPGNSPEWDPIVLANAKYDFVEYHFYPQTPGEENDTYLVQQAAQALTTNIEAIKSELLTAGKPDTPIYVGEIGSVYTNPGKQTTSITQALYAGQALGEMMNQGVSRATWWLGFGGCSDANSGNFSSSLYGWQNFGGYMVFSDGTPEYGCQNATTVTAGTLLPTARAFQLFGNVAVDGENVLTPSVVGDTTDVRAYAATHNGGTALVLFNLNENASEAVVITLSGQTGTSGGTVQTYSKTLYDQSKTNVWAAPTTTALNAQNFPLVLTLDPWSMNVVLLK